MVLLKWSGIDGKISGVDKFLSRRPILLVRPIGQAKKMAGQNQSVHPIETQLETLLSFLMCFHQKFSQ